MGRLASSSRPQRLLDLAAVALGHRRVGAQADLVGIVELRRLVGDVLGDVHQHRAGPARGRDMECLLDRDREVIHVLHQEVVLHARACDAHGVALLEGVLADGERGHLAGDHHHRDRIHVGRGDAGDRVGHARPAGDERNAALAGGAGVAVGRVQRALLVAHEHVLHHLLLEEGVVNEQYRPARIPEYILHALRLEAADDDFGAGQRFTGFSQRRGLHFHS